MISLSLSPLPSGLKSLSIGSLALTPTFSESVRSYTAATTNATNTITAIPTIDDAEVTITVNGSEIQSGTAASWTSGENGVVITVANPDGSEAEYSITVTRS